MEWERFALCEVSQILLQCKNCLYCHTSLYCIWHHQHHTKANSEIFSTSQDILDIIIWQVAESCASTCVNRWRQVDKLRYAEYILLNTSYLLSSSWYSKDLLNQQLRSNAHLTMTVIESLIDYSPYLCR